MGKFCGRCGTRLDGATGLCPRCSGTAGWAEKKPEVKLKNPVKVKTGRSVKGFFLRLCIWLVIWALLSMVIAGGLAYFDVVDIPVVDDVVHEIEMLLHKKHEWIDATCLDPRICEICHETEGEPLGHAWIPATCMDAERCSVCGETGKDAAGHDWTDATYTAPRTCEKCGLTQGDALGHSWLNATCTEPRICSVCGKTEGTALGHNWMDATYEMPKTCETCGTFEGEPLVRSWIYINELEYIDNYGKVWILCAEKRANTADSDITDENAYLDFNTPAYVTGPVNDYLHNEYTYGLCVDGLDYSEYSVTYYLGGQYTTFSGYVSMTPDVRSDSYATKGKYFEAYGDGVPLGKSPTMTNSLPAQSFSIDVTGVDVLTIRYPKTSGPSRMAMIFDGKLS